MKILPTSPDDLNEAIVAVTDPVSEYGRKQVTVLSIVSLFFQ